MHHFLSCSVTKEAKYEIWWKLEKEYFHLEVKDSGAVLRKINPAADGSAKLSDSKITETRSGWTITQHDDAATRGHETKQVIYLPNLRYYIEISSSVRYQ